jgi:hypothetical protein
MPLPPPHHKFQTRESSEVRDRQPVLTHDVASTLHVANNSIQAITGKLKLFALKILKIFRNFPERCRDSGTAESPPTAPPHVHSA